jgi:hypothetical protein
MGIEPKSEAWESLCEAFDKPKARPAGWQKTPSSRRQRQAEVICTRGTIRAPGTIRASQDHTCLDDPLTLSLARFTPATLL